MSLNAYASRPPRDEGIRNRQGVTTLRFHEIIKLLGNKTGFRRVWCVTDDLKSSLWILRIPWLWGRIPAPEHGIRK
jgi:hypothetical protein